MLITRTKYEKSLDIALRNHIGTLFKLVKIISIYNLKIPTHLSIIFSMQSKTIKREYAGIATIFSDYLCDAYIDCFSIAIYHLKIYSYDPWESKPGYHMHDLKDYLDGFKS